MYWTPPEYWKGETAVIIGGGPSLSGFDFAPVCALNVIGCNDAYLLGPWVDVCYWGDDVWYEHHRYLSTFREFQGLKVNGGIKYEDQELSLRRNLQDDLYLTGPDVGWFGNTGASAINLAVKLGAVKIILLGFDMKMNAKGENNWHPPLSKPDEEVYTNFQRGFRTLHGRLAQERPDVKVINANPDSALEVFPKMTLEEALR